jgi:hypothetical protein
VPEICVLTAALRAGRLDRTEALGRNGGAATVEAAEAGDAATAGSSVTVGGDGGATSGAGKTGTRRGTSGPNSILCGELPTRSNMNAANASNTIAAKPPTSHAMSLGLASGATGRDGAGGVAESRKSGQPQFRQAGALSVLTALHSSHTLAIPKPFRVGLVFDHADKLNGTQACECGSGGSNDDHEPRHVRHGAG